MHTWDDDYRTGQTPWDVGFPDPRLVEAASRGVLPRGRALDIGCGTGTDARYLAGCGWEETAVDLSPTAIERARAGGGRIRFEVHDILTAPAPNGPYDLVFDRGCLHVFDEAAERARFAEVVAGALAPGGQWLSLAGSTEGPARDFGPPRRSARDLVLAIEPHLEILELRRASFQVGDAVQAAWICRSGQRALPAQPSTRR